MSTEPAILLTAEMIATIDRVSFVEAGSDKDFSVGDVFLAIQEIGDGRVACYDTETHVAVPKMTEAESLVLYTGNTSICVQTSAFGIYLAALRDAGVIKP